MQPTLRPALLAAALAISALTPLTPLARAQPDIPIPAAAPVSPALAAADNSRDVDISIASDGTGHVVACWTTDRGLDTGQSRRLVVSNSADGGITWTTPSTPAMLGVPALESPPVAARVSTNRAGRWIVGWVSGTGGLGVVISSSDDHGATWTPARTLATTPGSNTVPLLCGDALGRWVAVWRTADLQGPGTGSVLAVSTSSDNGQTWSAPRAIAGRGPSSGSYPHHGIATDGQGRCVVALAYDDASDEGVRLLVSGDMGQTFGDPITIAASPHEDLDVYYNAAVDTDGQGHWVVTWSASLSPAEDDAGFYNIYSAHSTDHAATWSAPRRVNNNYLTFSNEFDLQPQIAFDGLGRCVITWEVWTHFQPTRFDVYAARSDDSGASWRSSVLLSGTASGSFNTDPVITRTQDNRLLIAWENLYGPGGDPDIVMRSTDDGGATFALATPLDPTARADSSASDAGPVMALDRRSRGLLVWSTNADLGSNPAHDTDLLIAVTSDAGQTWSSPAPLVATMSNDTFEDNLPAIAGNGAGTWMVAYAGQQPTRIRAGALVTRSLNDGESWSTPAVLSPDPTGQWSVDSIAVIHLGAQRWLTVFSTDDWLDGTIDFDFDLFYSLSTDDGQTWAPAELLNNDAVTDGLDDIRLALAAGGNTIIAIFNRGPARAIASIVSRDNGATWETPRFIVPDGGSRGRISLATDGQGRWIACWREVAPATDTLLSITSTDDGRTSSDLTIVPVPFPTSSRRIADPTIAFDRAGTWIITTTRDSHVITLRSIDAGQSWSPVRVLESTPTGAPTIASSTGGPSSSWVLAWPGQNPPGPLSADNDLYFTAFTIDDCNNNGRADALDITDFGAPDCDANMIPDACDLAAGRAADCNTNGILDSCEIAAGAPDVNRDGIPDACQCLADANADGAATLEDLFVFLQGWFGRTPVGDFNHNGSWTTDDLYGFLQAFFAGC